MTEQDQELLEEMFVQVATGASSTDSELRLNGVSPATLYFSDRPERIVGHLTNEQFVELWTEGDDSFAADPPNAVLSFIQTDSGMPEEAVVVLRAPRLGDDSITYSMEVLDGKVPADGGACALFIDPLGRPLSPVSVMGVRRREGRRVRRRML